MKTFRSASADDLWRQAFRCLVDEQRQALPQKSRAGETIEALHVAFELANPRHRWVVSRRPAINPAFAIAEVIWILAGSNDASVLNYWNRQLPKYAGSTCTYPGAYGHRLRKHFGIDQIRRAVEVLRADPDTRQVVLQLWDSRQDLPHHDGRPQTCDIPCNITSILKIRDGRLHWTQVMRSNDVVRGLPYNIIQFTTLQELIAGWLGVELGPYHHWSDSLHIYQSDLSTFSASAESDTPPHCESLMTGLDKGELLLAQMYERLQKLTAERLSERDLECMALLESAPQGYQSLLAILAAEAARRRSWFDLMQKLESRCTDSQIQQVWTRWKQGRTMAAGVAG